MPFDPTFRQQVQLLVSVLPLVAEESCFALQGGTAINLFVRDLPRLSVDIDLTYLPVAERAQSLEEIDSALKRIGERITGAFPDMNVQGSAPGGKGAINKLVVRTKHRLHLSDAEQEECVAVAQETFQMVMDVSKQIPVMDASEVVQG